MELAKINNYIKLINDMNIEELLRVLEFDRQQAIMEEKGKTYKLATAVKKVIDIKQLKKERPAFASIMRDKDGKLMNLFLTVRNGNDYHLETVQHGNERVLRARLDDAKFFFEAVYKLL